MSLSLFDLSDYPGNQGGYWKGAIQGSEGEKHPIKILDLSLLGAEDLILGSKQTCSEPSHCCLCCLHCCLTDDILSSHCCLELLATYGLPLQEDSAFFSGS